jgi:hypothetical protein
MPGRSVPFQHFGTDARLRSGFGRNYRGMRFNPYRPGLQSGLAHRTGNWDHDRYRQRYHGEHGRHHRRDYDGGNFFAGSYMYPYPGYLGYPYPYVLDPGFYDWSDSSDSGSEQGYASPDQGYVAADNGEPPPDYGYATPGYNAPPAYPEYGDAAYPPQRSGAARPSPETGTSSANHHPSASSDSEMNPPLTVIFKDDRKPEQIQNYMLSASKLTDLDREHYQQIPLEQINIPATQQANRAHGIDFRVPPAS